MLPACAFFWWSPSVCSAGPSSFLFFFCWSPSLVGSWGGAGYSKNFDFKEIEEITIHQPNVQPTNQQQQWNCKKKLSHLTKQNNNTHTHVHVIHAPIHTHRHIKCTNNEYRNPSAFSELLIGKIFTREFYRFCALQNINYNWKLLLLVGFYLYSLHSKISIV